MEEISEEFGFLKNDIGSFGKWARATFLEDLFKYYYFVEI